MRIIQVLKPSVLSSIRVLSERAIVLAEQNQQNEISGLDGLMDAVKDLNENVHKADPKAGDKTAQAVVNRFRHNPNQKLAFAEAQTSYNTHNLEKLFDSETAIQIARRLYDHFKSVGHVNSSWREFVNTKSIAPVR